MESGTRNAIQLSDAVAKEIRVLLVRRDMKQAELATRMGVSEMWLSRRLRGAQPIDLNDLQRIADALSVEVVDLLPGPHSTVASREGRTVVVSGTANRQTTVPKSPLAKRPSPFSQPKPMTPRSSTRRPVILPAGHP